MPIDEPQPRGISEPPISDHDTVQIKAVKRPLTPSSEMPTRPHYPEETPVVIEDKAIENFLQNESVDRFTQRMLAVAMAIPALHDNNATKIYIDAILRDKKDKQIEAAINEKFPLIETDKANVQMSQGIVFNAGHFEMFAYDNKDKKTYRKMFDPENPNGGVRKITIVSGGNNFEYYVVDTKSLILMASDPTIGLQITDAVKQQMGNEAQFAKMQSMMAPGTRQITAERLGYYQNMIKNVHQFGEFMDLVINKYPNIPKATEIKKLIDKSKESYDLIADTFFPDNRAHTIMHQEDTTIRHTPQT